MFAGDSEIPPEPPARHAVVTIGEMPAVAVRAGESTHVVIPVVIAHPYHVQANPASNEFLIPLELQLDPADGLSLGSPTYPPPTRYRLAGTTEDLLTYHGTVDVVARVTVFANAAAGERRLEGSMRYQACDSLRCWFPASVPVVFTIVVSDSG